MDLETPTTNNFEEKELMIERYLVSHPDDVEFLRHLMLMKLLLGKSHEAISIVDRLILLKPDDKFFPLDKAQCLITIGDTEAAKLLLEEALSTDPFLHRAYDYLIKIASYDAATDRAELNSILNRVEIVMEACKKKEKMVEELRSFRTTLVAVAILDCKYEEALQILQELIEEDPTDYRPYLNQGLAYILLEKKDEADKSLRQCRSLVPPDLDDSIEYYFDDHFIQLFSKNFQAISVMDEGKIKKVLEGYKDSWGRQSIDSKPPPITTDEREYERILEEQLNSNPHDVQSLRALMDLKIDQDRFPEALDMVDRLILLVPDDDDLPFVKAQLQGLCGDIETPKRWYAEVLSSNPFSDIAYIGLIDIATAYGHYDEEELDNIMKRVEVAMEICKEKKMEKELDMLKYVLSHARFREGKSEEALKILQEFVDEDPLDAMPYMHQMVIYHAMEKKDEAVKFFQISRKLLRKNNPWVQSWAEKLARQGFFTD